MRDDTSTQTVNTPAPDAPEPTWDWQPITDGMEDVGCLLLLLGIIYGLAMLAVGAGL